MNDDYAITMENGVFKVGPRGRHIALPEGWRQVKSGQCRMGDKFLNIRNIVWSLADPDDIGMEFDEFACLIRKLEWSDVLG